MYLPLEAKSPTNLRSDALGISGRNDHPRQVGESVEYFEPVIEITTAAQKTSTMGAGNNDRRERETLICYKLRRLIAPVSEAVP